MSDDVMKAAERLRGGFAYANCPDHCGECNDCRTVAAWALPLLDETALTDSWLLKAGFSDENTDSGDVLIIEGEGFGIQVEPSEGMAVGVYGFQDYFVLRHIKTCGDVRRLCLALNITLTERKDAV